MQMPTIQFKNGDEMPMIGLGTWKSNEGVVYRAVQDAIRIGYRHIDCAFNYGNEAEIGQAIADLIAAGEIKREELWITSKLWNDSHRKEHVLPAIQRTMKDLQVEYLDLYLIHWPVAIKHGVGFPKSADEFVSLEEVPLIETWEAMIDLYEKGLTKHIGVSNFNVPKIKDLTEKSGFQPEMNQVEMHPYLTQEKLVEYAHANGIGLTAYSPLGSNDRPPRLTAGSPVLMDDEVVVSIAEEHGVSRAQVLLAFLLHRGVAAVPKSANKERIKQNLESIQVKLTPQNMEQLLALNRNIKYIDGSTWTIPGSPNTMESLWHQ